MENYVAIILIAFGLIIVLLASGIWVPISVGLAGAVLVYFWVGRGIAPIGMIQFNIVNIFTFTPMPMFIFMGTLLLHTGISDRLYNGATSLVGFLPGALLHSNVVADAMFGAFSGSPIAGTAAIGKVAIPEVEKRGYNPRLIYGSVVAGAALVPLIPPSTIMIIYGVFVEQSIAKLFMAGLVPGLVLLAVFMLYIGAHALIRPSVAPERMKFSLKVMASGMLSLWPVFILILIVLGSLYLGFATPTESAAMGAVTALILAAFFRRLTWYAVKDAAVDAATITSWVMLIMIGAQIVSFGLAMLRVPMELSAWVVSLDMSPLVVVTLIVLTCIVLGMFIDGISVMLLTLPVSYPLMMSLGFDPIWFGVMVVVFIETAGMTPPVGMRLFIVYGISGRKNLSDVIIGSIPFFICILIMLVILAAFPILATWLPGTMIQPW